MTIGNLNNALNEIRTYPTTDSATVAKDDIATLKQIITAAEDALSAIGLKHRIGIYIDSCYGSGRSLALEDESGGWGDDVAAGDWVSSSNSGC